MLLLDADTIKGSLPMLAFCARAILCERVTCQIANHVEEEVSPMVYRRVTFIVHVEGLTNEEYRARMEQYEEFFRFLEQWFLPYDCEMDCRLKDYRQRFVLGDPLTLDYNALIAPLVAYTQQLERRIDEQREMIERLTKRLDALEGR